jgi:hypothetical protein
MSETLRKILEIAARSEKKEPQEQELLSFKFKDKDFLVTISHVHGQIALGTSDKKSASKVEIKIYEKVETDKRVFHGEIFGVLSKPEQEGAYKMQTISAFNVNSDFIGEDKVEKTSGHISGLITETMKQLIVSGIISEWGSAGLLSRGGNKIYEHLAKDPKLVVIQHTDMKKADGSPNYSYTVSASDEVLSNQK